MYSRRRFLKTLGALGAAYALPSFAADPFSLGVASGYPTPDGVVLWTRLAGNPDPLAVPVRWEIAGDEAFKSVLFSGTATAEPAWAHSVHVDVNGLAPERWYWYRFMTAGAESPIGRTRTAPAAGAADRALGAGGHEAIPVPALRREPAHLDVDGMGPRGFCSGFS